MLNRMTRAEAAEYIGCSLAKLRQMEQDGIMQGTYYEIGTSKTRRKLYIVERLDGWLLLGGEPAAKERLTMSVGNALTILERNSTAPYEPKRILQFNRRDKTNENL